LQELYGEHAHLTLNSGADGFAVEIEIPFHERNERERPDPKTSNDLDCD
jgi:hypothetical protein